MSVMHAPCDNCPFLKVGGIRLTRARIKDLTSNALRSDGGEFACHKTTYSDDSGEMYADRSSKFCGGSLIFAEKQGRQNQMSRIAERLGMFRPDALKNQNAVFDSVAQMLATAIDKPRKSKPKFTGEPCAIANSGCEAPAGFDHGGYIEEADTPPDAEFACDSCHDPVCGSCSVERDDERLCAYCAEES